MSRLTRQERCITSNLSLKFIPSPHWAVALSAAISAVAGENKKREGGSRWARDSLRRRGPLGFEVRNSQRFAHNMARLVEEAGKAATLLLQPRATNPTHVTLHDDLAPALRTFAQLQRAWLRQPYKAFEAQGALWNSC